MYKNIIKKWIIFDFDGTLNRKNVENKLEFNPIITLDLFNKLKEIYNIGIITNSKCFEEKYKNVKKRATFLMDMFGEKMKIYLKNPH